MSLKTEEQIETEATSRPGTIGKIYRIAPCEASRFWKLSSMFGLIGFVYSILRCMKDAVVSEIQMPASIVYLKMIVLPTSIIVILIVSYFINKLSVGTVLRASILIFGVFFTVYAITVPWHNTYMIFNSQFAANDFFGEEKMAIRGLGYLYPIALCINFYPSSCLYILSELWGNVVLSFLFMTYSNEILTFKQTMRFTPLYYIMSNIGLFVSGLTILLFGKYKESAPFHMQSKVTNTIIIICVVLTIVIAVIYTFAHREISTTPLIAPDTLAEKPRGKKKAPSFVDSLIYLLRSRVLLAWCLMTLGYNVCTNLIDSTFKPVMKAVAQHVGVSASTIVMNTEAIVQMSTATAVICILLTPCSRIVQISGWRFTGFITPTFTCLSSFFILSLAAYNTAYNKKNCFEFLNNYVNDIKNRIYLINAERWVGVVCVCGLKIGKYAFFDMTKEALAMRINSSERKMAKSIVDGIVGKCGKTGGAMITFLMFVMSGNNDLRCSSLYLFIFLFTMSAIWFHNVHYLSKKYNESIETNQPLDLAIIKLPSKSTK